MRLIDADKLIENVFKNPISYAAFCNLVKRQPTVDAVPVVRCKDCKWWRDTDHTCKEHSLVSPMMAEEYCSRGERKGDDHEERVLPAERS